jgi:hypothetical protein
MAHIGRISDILHRGHTVDSDIVDTVAWGSINDVEYIQDVPDDTSLVSITLSRVCSDCMYTGLTYDIFVDGARADVTIVQLGANTVLYHFNQFTCHMIDVARLGPKARALTWPNVAGAF